MKHIRLFERILMVILILIAITIIGYLILNFVVKKDNAPKEEKLVDEIKEYNYTLGSNATELYKNTFKELSTELSEKEVDNDLYAELISKLFIIDFYTLDNKSTKNDVGGVQFIYEAEKDNFILKATDTIYKYVQSNINGDRKQELPIVKNVEVTNIENTSYKYQKTTDANAYKVTLLWEYSKDLGYETSGTLILIHDGEKLAIAEKVEKEA